MSFLQRLFHQHRPSPMTVDLSRWACVECFKEVRPTLAEIFKVSEELKARGI